VGTAATWGVLQRTVLGGLGLVVFFAGVWGVGELGLGSGWVRRFCMPEYQPALRTPEQRAEVGELYAGGTHPH
jgi:hypothetical protein